MLKNIVNAALRNIIRHKSFSFINLLGLSVSMSLCMLIILIVKEQFTYDNFHKDSDRIYQVNTRALYQGTSFDIATVPFPVAQALRDEYTFAEDVVGVNRLLHGDASTGKHAVPLHGLFVDPSFLEVFNFPLAEGDINKALSSPNNIVLTKGSAEKLFGTKEAIGETISFGSYGEFTITGVLETFPGNTHFDFEVLASTELLPALEQAGKITQFTDNWSDFYASFAYIKLKEGKSVQEMQKALGSITQKYGKALKLDAGYTGYELSVYPLDKLTPGPDLANQMGSGIPNFVLIFLGALAAAVLVMSIFNFTNLMIAKSLTRAREVGVRKVVGAKRGQVFYQFVGESVVFALLALAFSFIILQFLKGGFTSLPLSKHFALSLEEDFSMYMIFVGFAVLVGVIAGLLPAGYLSAFKPLNVLRDSSNIRIYSKFTLRKALVTIQFTLCVIFVSVVLIIYSQVNFMAGADYGFRKENIVNVHLQGVSYEKIANEIEKLPGVDMIGGASHVFGTWNDRKNNYRRDRVDEPVAMSSYWVEDRYVEGLGLTFVAGRSFDRSMGGANERHIILNQKAVELFGFSDARSAVGQSLLVDDSVLVEVIGVVKDFHYRPLSDHIGPMALRYDLAKIDVLSVRIDSDRREEQIASIGGVWKKFDGDHELSYGLLEDELQDAYSQSGVHDFLIVTAYVAVLAVILACLGMLGMAMYSVQSRVKEVGIRKVMGASAADILKLLGKSFMILILIASLIGAPVSFIIGKELLGQFAFRIETGPLLIVLSVVIISAVGLITIWSQAIRAVVADPVKSLRYE